jgi:hypothetical protein
MVPLHLLMIRFKFEAMAHFRLTAEIFQVMEAEI